MGYQIKLPMDNQYYAPEISEFYVGFEYEMIYSIYHPNGVAPSDQWQNKLVDQYTILSTIVGLLDTGRIRVRCLSREDIESLGWVAITDNSFPLEKSFKWNTTGDSSTPNALRFDELSKTVRIDNDGSFDGYVKFFDGNIKNKSALKIIMQQIRVV